MQRGATPWRQGALGGPASSYRPTAATGVCTPVGSGKTHTMSGHEDIISDESYNGHDNDGIISRAMQYLFHQVCLALGRLPSGELRVCVHLHQASC
jgi:hypothetical protein